MGVRWLVNEMVKGIGESHLRQLWLSERHVADERPIQAVDLIWGFQVSVYVPLIAMRLHSR